MAQPVQKDPPRVVQIDAVSVLVLCGLLIALALLWFTLSGAATAFSAIAVATLLAVGLAPIVESIEQRTGHRNLALAIILLAGALMFGGVAAFLMPSAIDQARDLPRDLPRVSRELSELPVIGGPLKDAQVAQNIESFISGLPDRLAGDATPLMNAAKGLANLAGAVVVVLVITTALLLDGKRLLLKLRSGVPVHHRRRAELIWSVAYQSVGRYVTGSLTVAALAGIFTLTVGLVLGVPLAPLAAAWVMLWDLIPQIGGAMGGIPFVALAFTESPVTGLISGALFLCYLQLENNLISPVVVGKALKLSPLATMIVALIGVSAGGVVGALFAVPLAGAVKEVFTTLRPSASLAEENAAS